MKGYFRRPEATAAVLKHGWYHTGDLARVDTDGFFAIVGRKRTVIITGAMNVHPENVTTAIRGLEGVVDAVTFGLKDAEFGEIVVSCVVVAPDSGLDAEAIVTHCREHLSAEKVPAAVYLLADLPRGPAGNLCSKYWILLRELSMCAEVHCQLGLDPRQYQWLGFAGTHKVHCRARAPV